MARKRYPTGLSDSQWKRIEPLILPAKTGGHPRTTDMREGLNAMFYVTRTGCAWRMLPHDFPPWQTVYDFYGKWRDAETWETINSRLREQVRRQAGRREEPRIAIIDSQSVKTTDRGGERGFDAGKKVKGRKRHVLVDTLGLVLSCVVHAADVQDRDGAKWVLARATFDFLRLRIIRADGGYAGRLVDWTQQACHWSMEIIRRTSPGFVLLPKRWVV